MFDKFKSFMVEDFIGWCKDRLVERSTLDGAVIITASLAFLLVEPIATFIAYVALVYGVWTIIKEEW